MKRVLVAGELNMDLVFRACESFPVAGREVLAREACMVPGSSSMICAIGLARLGSDVSFIGVAGADDWGTACVTALQGAGVDADEVRRDLYLHTGITASLSTASDRALVTAPGAIAALHADEVTDAMLRRADHLHVSSYFLQRGLRRGLRDLFARAHALGLTTSLDPGFDPAQQWGEAWPELLAQVDVFLPNDVELAAISGCADAADGLRALDNGRTRIVVKRGRDGCATLDAGVLRALPGFAVDAVDSTGAGDSFDAGFLHAWLRGDGLEAAMRWGNACGALSTRGVGGTAAQPDVAGVQALLDTQA